MARGRERDQRREARWRRIVREQSRSGLGVRAFCRQGRLTEGSFYFWRSELERRQAQRKGRRVSEPPGIPAFVSVRIAEPSAPPAGGRIEIELPGGRRVHVAAPVDRQALADVLAVLEGGSC